MKNKSIIQLIILSLILILLFAFFKIFFNSQSYLNDNKPLDIKNKLSSSNQKINIETKSLIEDDNIITNLEYKSNDALGNEYIIKSKSAESNLENANVLKLSDVSAIVYIQGKDPIYISSGSAIHDKISFNTKFFDQVKIQYSDLNINSENLDLLYEKNLVNLYNINRAFYGKSELIADKITLNILKDF